MKQLLCIMCLLLVLSGCAGHNKDPKRDITFEKIDSLFKSDDEARCLIRIADMERGGKVKPCYYLVITFNPVYRAWEPYCSNANARYNKDTWQDMPLAAVCDH